MSNSLTRNVTAGLGAGAVAAIIAALNLLFDCMKTALQFLLRDLNKRPGNGSVLPTEPANQSAVFHPITTLDTYECVIDLRILLYQADIGGATEYDANSEQTDAP